MKKIYNIFLFIFIQISIIGAQNNIIDEVAWIVGDDAILKSDIEEQRLRALYEKIEIQGNPYCVIPEELAIQKLLLHQAKIDSITVAENTVNQQVEQRIEFFISQIGSKERLEQYFNKNIFVLREDLKEMIEEQMIAQQMKQKIVGDIKLTPSEVRNFYNELPQEILPVIPAKTEIQLITIEPTVSKQEIESVKEKLREFKERIESGSIEFSTLAVLYSEDPESAKRGGELGFMGKGMLVPEFANVAFNLNDTKKVSRIVETEFGFHIIQLVEKRGDKFNFRHILLKPKVSFVEKSKAMSKLDSIAENIRLEKETFEQAVLSYSFDKKTKMNAGLMANPQTGDSKFENKDLPLEISTQIKNMNVGEISKPFIMKNSSGKEVCAIIKVKSKTKTHTANLNEDYQIIKEALQKQKSEELFKNWILNKQKETYVKINDNWNNCVFRYPGWNKN